MTVPLEFVGPLGIRQFQLPKVCTSHQGHAHNYDHTTVVITGSLEVHTNQGVTGPYGPGDAIPMPAQTWHMLKALEPNTKYLCIFSHRDFAGIVSQEYVGNLDAYDEFDQTLASVSPRPLPAYGG